MSQAREFHRLDGTEDPAGGWLSNSRSTLLVVITLITTLSFQAGVTPPGGFWQDDSEGNGAGDKPHTAGDAILKQKNPNRYLAFSVASWLCFYSSVLLVVWLLTGVVSHKSLWFKGQFLFCISTLVFLFQASQTDAHLPGSFSVMASVFVYFALVFWRGKSKSMHFLVTSYMSCCIYIFFATNDVIYIGFFLNREGEKE